MAVYVYRPTSDGSIKAEEVAAKPPLRGTPAEATMGFHQMVLNAYKHVEANGKWQGPYAKATVKQAHETAMACDAMKCNTATT